MSYQSNWANVRAQMEAARDAGLVAAAEVVRTEVKRGLRGGYFSGDFVTGRALNSVERTDPYDATEGRAVSVFSRLNYVLFYEVGHYNIFRRKFTRKEVWAPSLINTTPAQLAAFERVFVRFMAA